MKLLKDIHKETKTNDLLEVAAAGATSAGAVAGFRAPIGGTSHKTKMFRRNMPKIFAHEEEEEAETTERDFNKEVEEFRKRAAKDKGGSSRRRRRFRDRRPGGPAGGAFTLSFEGIEDEKFDSADVVSKLRAAQEKATSEDDVAGFALEDTEGQIVKVYVAKEEAEEFERALGAALAGEDEDDNNENTPLEIAEVLFNLKDRFNIVDVVWPPVDGDPEEQEDTEDDLEVELDDEEAAEGEDEDGDMEADLQDEDGDGEADNMDAEDETRTALQSVIDLLKSQADAQRAEAEAKAAEAEAEEARYNAQAAELKMRQEEEVLDMEAYYDKQKEAEQEANKLKKLAKFRHEVAQKAGDAGIDMDVGADDELPEEEEEHISTAVKGEEIPGNKFERGWDENKDHRMSPQEFIRYILQHQQGQG